MRAHVGWQALKAKLKTVGSRSNYWQVVCEGGVLERERKREVERGTS
jgi:hypothetical protein